MNLLLLFTGILSLYSLNVRQYPRSDSAIATIRTVYVGADADLVRGFVTTPIERVVASADGIDYLESSSAQGLSTVTAHLKLNYDTNAALAQLQSKVAEIRNDLPPEAEAPVISIETSDNRFASMYLSFSSDVLKQNEITDYLIRVVQPKLSSLDGVQKADVLGGRTFAMRIWLDSEKMAAYGVTPTEVQTALQQNNFLSAVGSAKGPLVTVNLTTDTDLQSVKDFEELVVKSYEGKLIRLRDIANVVLGAESYDEEVRFDGQAATFMGIWVLPSANSLDVIKEVRRVIPAIRANLPAGMKAEIPYDATEYIQDALDEVFSTLIETILIVIIVIYLFIGSFRGVLVPVLAIPLSLVGAGIIMVLFGFSINLLTLLAIVLAVGLVVDDAIVMLENIERYVSKGMEPLDAAIKGARELVLPIIAMTITLATVYAPIGLQGGLTGALFREFAFTLAGTVIISGFVALTLSPMVASRLLRKNEKPSRVAEFQARYLSRLKDSYRRSLEVTLRGSAGVLTSSAILIVFGVPFFMFSMKELAPREDQGVVFGIVQASPNSSIDQTSIYSAMTYEIFSQVPEYDHAFQLTSPTGGFSGIVAKPWSERSRTTQEIEQSLWGTMSTLPGIRVIVTTPPPLPGGSDFPVEMVITSTSQPEEIVTFAEALVGKAFASGRFMFADTDLKFDLPQGQVHIDRAKVASMGLTLGNVGTDLGILVGGNYVNRFNIAGRSYKVIPQVNRSARFNPEQLENLYITGPNGSVMPASSVAHVERRVAPQQLNRFQQLNSAKVHGVQIPGVSLDQALTTLEEEARKILPAGYEIDYAGESRQLREEGNTLMISLLIAFVLIFLVLAAQFESFIDPIIILLGSVPLALAGSLIFVFLGFSTLNIYSQVGLITLVGLVSKNGILIVEFANELRREGKSVWDSIVEGSATRFRPVLMTSVATVVGHFPLILASGAGAAARNSIGITLVSGMAIGTFFTLFVVPSIYYVIHSYLEDSRA
jgi:multidrug efflux pump